jgi:hypothetical protein
MFKKNIICFILILFFFNSSFAQASFKNVFFSKKEIKDNHIDEIKDFTNLNTNTVRDTVYRLFKFNKGLIDTESVVSKAASVSDNYDYIKSSNNKLSFRFGNANEGIGNQQYFSRYKYLGEKLKLVIYGYNWPENNVPDEYETLTKYFYHPTGKINYKVVYDIDKEGLISNSLLNRLIQSPDSDKPPAFIKTLNSQEARRTYFLYSKNDLIGYFPRDENIEYANLSDTIYSDNKLNELKKIGLDKFRNKYFTEAVYKKVIDDSYLPIKNKELLVNGKPIKEFLSKIGKGDVKYIVFEISDNNFLFYKITD